MKKGPRRPDPAVPEHLLLLFLDGVGIGPPDPGINPFLTRALPHLHGLFDGSWPTLERSRVEGDRATAFPLDARLGMEGLPQSGTGQSSLLTGRNAARMFGRHFGPWTPVSLRPLVSETSLLARVANSGGRVAFANAIPRAHRERAVSRRPVAPTLAALGAGALDRDEDHLARGDAVASELVNDRWRSLPAGHRLPAVTPEQAGSTLARIAGEHDLTLFAHYRTDVEGHRGGEDGARRVLVRLDRFFAGLLASLTPGTLLFVASDHGNLEDLRGGHTENPALGMAVGPRPPALRLPRTLLEVTPYLLALWNDRLRLRGPAAASFRPADRASLNDAPSSAPVGPAPSSGG